MKVKLSDIIDAIEMANQYSEYFLDKQTGEIEFPNNLTCSNNTAKIILDYES